MRVRRIALVCAAAALVFAGCAKNTGKAYRVGLVNFVTGAVQITGPGGKVFDAKVGTPLDEGMKIRTMGKNSLCEIYVRDTALKIFPDSELDISRLGYAKTGTGEQTAMSLSKGKLFVRVVKKISKDDRFGVKTPLCVAAVRGTQFFVTKNEIACLDGKVEVRSLKSKSAAPVTIEDGEGASPASKEVKKKDLSKDTVKKLEADAKVKPIEAKNQELFDRLDKGDSSALKNLKARIREMSGGAEKKKDEEKPDIDLFFFKG